MQGVRSSSSPGVHHRPWLVIVAWTVFFLVLTPTALQYAHSVNYAGSSSNLSGSESERAQALLATVAPSHSTLIVVVEQGRLPASSLQNRTLDFQAAIEGAKVPFVNASESVYTAYAAYLDGLFGPSLPLVRSVAASTANLTDQVYGFPARFLEIWTANGATAATLNSSFVAAHGTATGYEGAFLAQLWSGYFASVPAEQLVQSAVGAVAPSYFPVGPALNLTLSSATVANYSAALPYLVAQLLASEGIPPVPVSWVSAAILPGDFGTHYVAENGLTGLPSFLRTSFLSPDGSLSLVLVTFTVSESYRTASGVYPAQAATPEIRALAAAGFGSSALVTGAGAAAYDAQQLTQGSGILFALTFLFLGIAVALTLRSWVAPILTLLLVSLSTFLGYLAIEVTGLLVGKVDFTVTYTLTAVTLGVATDYALFMLYRYREELTRGREPREALETATRSSRFAILVSALTVAAGLGSLSLLSGLRTWGPVLAISILAIAFLELTILPALVRLIGPRLFVRRWLRPARPPERSAFYRAAARSGARPLWVVALAVVIAVPSVAAFIAAPTSYDFSGGLPASTPSAHGQQLIEQQFGANLLYPVYVIVTAQSTYFEPNGTVSPEGLVTLPHAAAQLVALPGVRAVDGPFVSGRNLSSAATGGVGAFAYALEHGRSAYFVVYSSYGPYSPAALSLVSDLRSNPSYLVGGLTSSVLDQQAQDRVQYPVLELVLTLFIAVILGLAFRSVAIPLISLSGVGLSITATTGLLYLIATYLLHAPLLWLVPLILFVILMSLGNDYTVFLLARVREEAGRSGPTEGIRRGIAGSGVVVSALGVVLAASLGSLALQPISFLQEVGIAFVLSLILDTFVVRPLYFPALLTLAQRWRAHRKVDRPAPGAAPPGIVPPPEGDGDGVR